jgi:hypothetical protein
LQKSIGVASLVGPQQDHRQEAALEVPWLQEEDLSQV